MTYAERIRELKTRLGDDVVILGHHYVHDDVIRHCDLSGDSLELARRVPEQSARYIVFCGVFFMGESAALLVKPGQSVHMPDTQASCIMSDMAPADRVEAVLARLQASGKTIVPLTYVNSSAAVKGVVGAAGGTVCTSANATTMLEWCRQRGDAVLFLPDKNLAMNTANQLGMPEAQRRVLDIRQDGAFVDPQAAAEAELLMWPGCCAIHSIRFKATQIEAARQTHPGCKIIVHPECSPEVVDASDAAGSTSTIIRYCADAPAGAVVYVGTEINLVERLAARHAGEKTILPLRHSACLNMGKNSEARLAVLLEDLATAAAEDRAPRAETITVAPETAEHARVALTRMLEACA